MREPPAGGIRSAVNDSHGPSSIEWIEWLSLAAGARSIYSCSAMSVHARTPRFEPALEERRVAHAFASSAEAVILDLEDAVAHARKRAARETVAATPPSHRPRTYVRINPVGIDGWEGDLEVAAGVASVVVVPKVASAADIHAVAAGLDASGGQTSIVALVETAERVGALDAVGGASARVAWLALGLADLSLDLGITSEPPGPLAQHAGCDVSLASRRRGVAPPLDSAHPRLRDLDALREEAAAARSIGFGEACIQPEQLEIVAAEFTPPQEAIEHATAVIADFQAAERLGEAAAEVAGHLVDYPIAERAADLRAQAGESVEWRRRGRPSS